MKVSSVDPAPAGQSDRVREFAVDEVFFSTTDRRGVITSGNAVFVRVSGYAEAELVGRAHNIIRHPAMPRVAFRTVWEYLEAERRVVALVRNRAKDGSHYDVVALIGPATDGFLSIRFKPTSALVAPTMALYARVRAEEDRQLAAGAPARAAMEASAGILSAGLRELGFADFDAYMRALLCEELKSRDAELAQRGLSVVRELDPRQVAAAGEVGGRLQSLYGCAVQAYRQLGAVYARLDEFAGVQQALENKSSFVEALTLQLRVAAMNVALASGRIGASGQGLGVISHHMGATAGDIAQAARGLSVGIAGVTKRLRSVVFNLAAGRLQLEMILAFIRELVGHRHRDAGRLRMIRQLQQVFRHSLTRASAALGELEAGAAGLSTTSEDLARHMLSLQVAQLGGMVEVTRVADQASFGPVFATIREQIDGTRHELTQLTDALVRLASLADESPETARELQSAAKSMEDDLAALAAS